MWPFRKPIHSTLNNHARARPEATPPTPGQVTAARSIAGRLNPLIAVAEEAGLDMLAYLLELAEVEARRTGATPDTDA